MSTSVMLAPAWGEQLRLIQELEDKDRSIVFAIIDKMLTTKKFKDFFNNNAALL